MTYAEEMYEIVKDYRLKMKNTMIKELREANIDIYNKIRDISKYGYACIELKLTEEQRILLIRDGFNLTVTGIDASDGCCSYLISWDKED